MRIGLAHVVSYTITPLGGAQGSRSRGGSDAGADVHDCQDAPRPASLLELRARGPPVHGQSSAMSPCVNEAKIPRATGCQRA